MYPLKIREYPATCGAHDSVVEEEKRRRVVNKNFKTTRPKPAYGRQGLDWIVGPGYSFVVFSTNKTMETNQKTRKTMKPP